MGKVITNYLNTLRSCGLKATDLRVSILRLLDKKHGPFSAKDIHDQLGKTGNITTVYRCLEKFIEKGLVNKCDFNDGFARYELLEDNNKHHHHLICTGCRDWIKVDTCLESSAIKSLGTTGFTKITHKLEFFGICPDCH